MYGLIAEHVFPWMRELGGETSLYAKHMENARFTIPTPALLGRVVDLIDEIPMDDRDTKGDLYEYLLSKIASAGQNGQFRTPRHIIQLMVELTAPKPDDIICDPACGTCGFLVAAGEYLRDHQGALFSDERKREHFHNAAFPRLRLRLHHAAHRLDEHAAAWRRIPRRSSATTRSPPKAAASPRPSPWSSPIRPSPARSTMRSTANNLLSVVKTKKTELLFIALFLRLLKPGGRAAVIVPDGVLFGSSKAHKDLRRMLVEDQKLDGVIKLPSGVFRPYAGVSTAILVFTKTNRGGTDHVWFYDVAGRWLVARR